MGYKPTHANGTFTKFGAPEIEKLYNDRYRIVVRCNVKGVDSKWHYSNINNFWKDFGSLYDSPLQVDGEDVDWEPATGETYPNMRLVEVSQNYPRTPNDGAPVLEFTYETLTGSYVQDADDKVDHELNGLRRVTRTVIATEDASYAKVVGTATIAHTGRGYGSETLTLASAEEVPKRQNEGGFTRIQETWVASGTLSETTDNVGSQQSKVIETIGADPATPSGYSLASKQESNFEGLQTNRFTFLKDNVVLSESEDNVGSQAAIVQEVFNGTPATPSGYSVASTQESDVDGIPTKRYTFLKDNVVLSESEDEVGSQNSIVQEVFNGTPDTPSGYSVASKQESNVDGIPTKRYTFLKDNVVLSESEDKVGSQAAIVQEVFNGTPVTPSGYSIASEQESDVDGIPTKRFTFLMDDVVLSESEDKVGSQLAIVQEVFNGDPDTPTGYSIASKQESDVNGIPTKRFTFLKDNVILSESEDKVGSQAAIVQEVFNGTPATPSGYVVASEQESDVDGIPTKRYTFLKDNVVLSESEDKVGSQAAIVQEVFNGTPATPSGYVIASEQESDVDGIPTRRYTFLRDNSIMSESRDRVGSQLAITQEVFGDDPVTPNGYSLASLRVSNVDGISTRQFTFLKDNVELSRTNDYVGSQLSITREFFNPASDPTESGYSLASKQQSDFEGIKTVRYVFLRNSVLLSQSEDEVGSQNAIIEEWFNPDDKDSKAGYLLASRQESNIDGIPTERYTFLKPSILSLKQELSGGSKQVSVQAFGLNESDVIAALSEVTSDHVLLSQSESDYAGIKTTTFEFRLDESFTEDYELNGLQRISLVELSVSNFTAQTIGSVSSSAPTSGLYLGTQRIDNGGSIKTRESTWLEAGTLNVQRRSESEGVYRVTTTFLGVEGSVFGPIIARVEDDYEGLKTITVVSMQDASGASLVAVDSQPVASHSTLSEFSYPGVVTISAVTLSGQNNTYTFNAKDFSLKPPVVSRVPATIKVSFKTTSAISYTGTGGLWNPTTWAEGSSKGIGWNYAPFSIARGFRGYRINPNATNSYSGFGIPGTSNVFDMISGKRIFGDTTYSIQVSGGPPDPSGVQYTLDYSVSLAFEDVDGVSYYKHKEIVATIPSQAGASGGGSEETTDVLP